MPSVPFPPENHLLIVSPHLDDAVFSCGMLMALRPEVDMLTVFAGIPFTPQELTDWDKLCGFRDAHEAMIQRRDEDLRASLALSAHPIWLDFLDSQYRGNVPLTGLHAALSARVKNLHPTDVFFPMGLFHSDHEAVHLAMMEAHREFPEISWWMYEEALYRRIPGLVQQRLATLETLGLRATPTDLHDPAAVETKRAGVQCYASQLRGLKARSAFYADIYQFERYWRVERA